MDCQALEGFTQFEHSDSDQNYCVYQIGEGSPVVLMHELPGMGPECLKLAKHLAAQGFTVYLPLLFGKAGEKTPDSNFAHVCVSKEFHVFREGLVSPITAWLRNLCGLVHKKHNCNIGVIGMCFTGGLVLALMADPFVTAPVMCQPALPLKPFGDKSGLGVSPEELKAAKDRKIPVLALRFTGDTICSENRIERLRNEFGECFRFIPVEPPADKPDAHSIITEEWTRNPNQSIRDALDAVVRFLKSQSAS